MVIALAFGGCSSAGAGAPGSGAQCAFCPPHCTIATGCGTCEIPNAICNYGGGTDCRCLNGFWNCGAP